MDKVVSKKLAAAAGVPIVPYVDIRKDQWRTRRDELLDACLKTLIWPMFVKPARHCSSVGITKVKDGRDALAKACDYAFEFDEKIWSKLVSMYASLNAPY